MAGRRQQVQMSGFERVWNRRLYIVIFEIVIFESDSRMALGTIMQSARKNLAGNQF